MRLTEHQDIPQGHTVRKQRFKSKFLSVMVRLEQHPFSQELRAVSCNPESSEGGTVVTPSDRVPKAAQPAGRASLRISLHGRPEGLSLPLPLGSRAFLQSPVPLLHRTHRVALRSSRRDQEEGFAGIAESQGKRPLQRRSLSQCAA